MAYATSSVLRIKYPEYPLSTQTEPSRHRAAAGISYVDEADAELGEERPHLTDRMRPSFHVPVCLGLGLPRCARSGGIIVLWGIGTLGLSQVPLHLWCKSWRGDRRIFSN